jgi:YesN/AraC family two-component response regulator
VEELFTQMLQEFQKKDTGYLLSLQAFSLQLLIFIGRYLESHQTVSFEHPSPMHEKVSEIARYINNHYMDALSLETLARHFYISPSYLSKVFKRVTNFTFVEYLNNVRVKEAKRLLIESRMKIVKIAEEVGFGSITHFGRIFKEITGNPPMYYRKLKK